MLPLALWVLSCAPGGWTTHLGLSKKHQLLLLLSGLLPLTFLVLLKPYQGFYVGLLLFSGFTIQALQYIWRYYRTPWSLWIFLWSTLGILTVVYVPLHAIFATVVIAILTGAAVRFGGTYAVHFLVWAGVITTLAMPLFLKWGPALHLDWITEPGLFQARLLHGKELLPFVQDKWLWGCGAGAAARLGNNLLFVPLAFPHNLALQLWLEGGLLSVVLVALQALFRVGLWPLQAPPKKKAKKPPNEIPWPKAIQSGAITGLGLAAFFYLDLWSMAVLALLGVLFSASPKDSP